MPAVSYDAVCLGLIKFHAGFKSTFRMSAGSQKASGWLSVCSEHCCMIDNLRHCAAVNYVVCLVVVSLYFYCSNQIENRIGFCQLSSKGESINKIPSCICIHICQRLYRVETFDILVCVFHFHNFACLPQDVAHCTAHGTQFCLTYDKIKAQRLPLMQMPWRVSPLSHASFRSA